MNQATAYFYLIILAFLFYLNHRWQIHALLLRNRKFSCARCGHCCRLLVRLSDIDIKRIEAAGKKDFYRSAGKIKILKRINGYCPYLTIKNSRASCTIYNYRPDICRSYPSVKILCIKGNDPRCSSFSKKTE